MSNTTPKRWKDKETRLVFRQARTWLLLTQDANQTDFEERIRPLATKKEEDPTESESDFMADFDSATKTLTPGLFTSTRDVEELTRLDDVQSHQIVHLETI